jgi:NTP pyrophosphatase (non-canonical NTP hydrolase)
MPLKEVQKDVEDWVSQYKIGYFEPHQVLARLMEEVGELAREINHLYGPKKKKPSEQTKELNDEMADIIFTLCCLANPKKLDLDESWQRMMDKLRTRDDSRFEKK